MELVRKTYVFRSVKRVIVIPIIFFLFVVCYYEAVTRPSKLISSVQTSERLNAASSSTKTILIWNPYSRFELEVFGEGADTFNSHRCPINNCFITKNRSWAPLHEFDGIIFNMPPLSLYKFPVDEHRRPEQRYIFFLKSPQVTSARK